MTAVDLIIIAVTLLLAAWGYTQGLIVGALSLAGFVGGAFLGSRVGPLLLEEGSKSPFAPLVSLVGALICGAMLALGFEALGFGLRRRMGAQLGVLDGFGGAALIGCLALLLAWLAGAVALHSGSREFRRDVQRSSILRALNATLPPSGPLLRAVARFDPFPAIEGPSARVRRPDPSIARDPQVRAARSSVVKVLGTACGLGVQGSGWVGPGGVVITNAHVIAGQKDTTVQLAGETSRHDADAIFFDSRNDLAVLRSPGVAGAPGLPLNTGADAGTSAAILGFPSNGPYTVRAGRLGPTSTVTAPDAYGRGPIRRRVTAVRGVVSSGYSGGPMVDGEGQVVTTIFATAIGERQSGLGVPDSILERALASADERVSTGPCVG